MDQGNSRTEKLTITYPKRDNYVVGRWNRGRGGKTRSNLNYWFSHPLLNSPPPPFKQFRASPEPQAEQQENYSLGQQGTEIIINSSLLLWLCHSQFQFNNFTISFQHPRPPFNHPPISSSTLIYCIVFRHWLAARVPCCCTPWLDLQGDVVLVISMWCNKRQLEKSPCV